MIVGLAERGLYRVIPAGLLLIFAASRFAPAQSSPPNGAAKTLPVINVTTRLVYLDVVVRDANGQPVHNLTQQDFKVEEDGRQQKVDFFASHTSDETPAPTAPLAMAPTEFSNVPTQKNSPAVNMILFDLVNTPQLDQLYARRQLLRFLRELPQGQQIALFALSDRLHMIQSFTSSSDQLIAAASAIDAKDFHLIRSSSQIMNDADFLNNFLQAMGRDPGQLGAHMRKDQVVEDARTGDRRARVTLQAFAELANAVSGYPGRKNLFWLSEDFPLTPTLELQFNDLSLDARFAIADLPGARDTANLVASAQIAVYPISLSGLDTGAIGSEISGSGEVSGGSGQTNITAQNQFAVRQQMRSTMEDLARQTGGEAFYGSNDFAGALQRSLAAGSNYYTLAYQPSNQRWDGRLRKIHVALAHKGDSLMYRHGYYAIQDTQPGEAAQQLDFALQPETPQSTMLLLRSKVVETSGPQRGVMLDCNLDAGNIAFTETSDEHRHAQLLVKLVAFSDSGPQPATAPQNAGMLKIDFDPAHYQLVLKDGIAFRPHLPLSPGKYRIRLGVTDMQNHRTGTLDIPFTLDAKTAASP